MYGTPVPFGVARTSPISDAGWGSALVAFMLPVEFISVKSLVATGIDFATVRAMQHNRTSTSFHVIEATAANILYQGGIAYGDVAVGAGEMRLSWAGLAGFDAEL